MPESFVEALSNRLLVCDGASGTMFYEKGVYINRCYEELNVTQPDLVRELHREYIKGGVDIIETNTFAANRYKLKRFNLEGRVEELNRAGVALAREESRGSVFIAAAVGPLGVTVAKKEVTAEEARTAYHEQLSAIVAEKPDLIIFETFHDLDDLTCAITTLRAIAAAMPVVAQMSFDTKGSTSAHVTPEEAVAALEKLRVSALGANCSSGPAPMLDTIKRMAAVATTPLIAQPNSGPLEANDDRMINLTTPEYLMTYGKRYIRAGAKIVGGCCGATPRHITVLRGAALALSPSRVEVSEERRQSNATPSLPEVATIEKTAFARKLCEGKWVQSVELLPPKGPDATKLLAQGKLLKEAGIDCVNLPDGPRAMARMNPLATALLFRNEVGIEPIIHYTTRDRNLLGMQADLLGAHALGVRNILAITGDPPKLGNYPDSTAVYDVDAIGLVKIIRNLNRGQDLIGTPINGATAHHIGVGANPGALNLDEEVRRFEQKVASGAEFCMTQPVFDKEKLFTFLRRVEHCRIPILVGILPLASSRSAEFLHNEVPGMEVPHEIRARLREAGEDARKIGIAIARQALAETRSAVQGVYVMAPVGGARASLDVLAN